MTRVARGLALVFAGGLVAAACSSPDPGSAPTPDGDDGGSGSRDGAPVGEDGGPILPGDGGSSDQRLWTGGSRLKARYYDTADGTSTFIGWRDTQIAMSCSFNVAADGKLRCLPYGEGIQSTGFYFKDAGCTQKISIVYTGGRCPPAAPKYANEYDATQCPSRSRFYDVGAKLATTTAYYRDSQGVCRQTSFAGSQDDLYDVGAEVAPTTFVGASEQQGPDYGGVVRIDVVADDGARGFLRFQDVGRSAQCSFRTAADGSFRCVPLGEASVFSGEYSNASCTAPVAGRGASACPAPKIISEYVAAGCGSTSKLYAGGAGASAFYKNGATCTAYPPSSSTQYFSVGAEIPASQFLEARLSAPVGTARVKTKMIELRGQPHPSTLYDSQRNEDCSFQLAGDGIIRCLPSSRGSVYFFSDAACTQRLAYVLPTTGCNTPFTFAPFYDDSTCPSRTRIFSIGAQTNPAQLYVKLDNNSCVTTTFTTANFFILGAELPPSSFMAAGEVDR